MTTERVTDAPMVDIQRTPSLAALAAALTKAQAAFPQIPRDKTVTVQTRTGGSYTFKYAPLDTILAAVRGPLSENGLALAQLLDGDDLVTLLLHESGDRLEGRTPLPRSDGDTIQALGSAITYLRRYAIQALLAIASEEDDDGNSAAGNQARETVAGSNGETLEMLGNLQKAGTIATGGSEAYKLEWKHEPDGNHAIGFRLVIPGEDRDIPQVMVKGVIGEALYLATAGEGGELLKAKVTVKGKLWNVRQKGRTSYYRLIIGDGPADFIETPDVRIPALETEAETVALFPDAAEPTAEEQAAIYAAEMAEATS